MFSPHIQAKRSFGTTTVAMVESMDHSEDVGRLFSWLKAPMVHYREFAPEADVADAVATWPSVHKAAAQSGVAMADEAAPRGSIAARARLARERMTMPEVAVQAMREHAASAAATPPAAAPSETVPPLPTAPLHATVVSAEPIREAAPRPLPYEPPPTGAAPEPALAGFDEPAPPPPATSPIFRAPRQESAVSETPQPQHYPPRDNAALFGGGYRGPERNLQPRGPAVADRQDRSLGAVFSRLSGAREGLPDPRTRSRTSPGLGTVFGRLR